MRLIIQIPCYNEEATLPATLADLPHTVAGFDEVEWLVIDDGSTDDTINVAKKHGVDHIVQLHRNEGLAKAFMAGLEAGLKLGADVIVNTDADNQYDANAISSLTKPILEHQADIVIGARPISDIEHFSQLKRTLQKLGSSVVRLASSTDVSDAPSGFRAFSREAAMHMNVFSNYTYTLETIIQAGSKGLTLVSVPVKVNQDLRPSRLVKNIWSYVYRSMATIIRISVLYKPFASFFSLGMLLLALGVTLGLRFVFYWLCDEGQGHVQSLILASVFLAAGFQSVLIAFIADLMAVNRRLLEDLQVRARKKEYSGQEGQDRDENKEESHG